MLKKTFITPKGESTFPPDEEEHVDASGFQKQEDISEIKGVQDQDGANKKTAGGGECLAISRTNEILFCIVE